MIKRVLIVAFLAIAALFVLMGWQYRKTAIFGNKHPNAAVNYQNIDKHIPGREISVAVALSKSPVPQMTTALEFPGVDITTQRPLRKSLMPRWDLLKANCRNYNFCIKGQVGAGDTP